MSLKTRLIWNLTKINIQIQKSRQAVAIADRVWSGVRGEHGVAREKERKKQLSNEININFLKKRWGIVKMEEKKISNNRQRDKFTILISYWLKLLRKLSLFLILFNNKLRLFLCQTQFGRCLLQRLAQKPPAWGWKRLRKHFRIPPTKHQQLDPDVPILVVIW